MMNDGVARRNYARETGYSGGKYFEKVGAINENTNEKILWFGTGLRVRMMAGKQMGIKCILEVRRGNAELSYQINQKSVLMDLQ
ncbi:hypothetical protein PO124_22460 [Bacillus licheniformis]|nr:hypothetical protein [Bacillus licheniformis]